MNFAEGHYEALVATVTVSSDVAASLLPRGTALLPQELTPAGTHPLMMMFGHHTRVHPAFIQIRGWSYHEFLVAIPWIGRVGDPDECSTMPRLYLDSWPMVVAGWIYAFPKVRARVKSGEGFYRVSSFIAARRVVEASWSVTGPPGPTGSIPNFAAVAPAFRQPFLQRFLPLPIERSVMSFDLDAATLQGAKASLILTPFLRGLKSGELECPALEDRPTGAFVISVPWVLSLPSFV